MLEVLESNKKPKNRQQPADGAFFTCYPLRRCHRRRRRLHRRRRRRRRNHHRRRRHHHRRALIRAQQVLGVELPHPTPPPFPSPSLTLSCPAHNFLPGSFFLVLSLTVSPLSRW